MSRVPTNIKKMLNENARIETAQIYANTISKGTIQASWHEHDFQRNFGQGGGALRKASLMQGTQHIVPGSAAEMHAMGVREGLASVKSARQARLKELYEREALAYEAELNALGLSLVKARE